MTAPESNLQDLKEHLNQLQTEIDRVEHEKVNSQEVKDLLTWTAPSRVFRKRDKTWFTNVAILVLLLIVILLFIREFIAISVVMAIAFVYYVLATVPPDNLEHKITTQGITSAGHTYLWSELTDFWFMSRQGQQVLTIGTKLRYPGRLFLLLGEKDREKVQEVLASYLPFREIPKISWLDKFADALARRLPASMR